MLSLHHKHFTNYSNEGYRRDLIHSPKNRKGIQVGNGKLKGRIRE
jgi:hypothetical protein